MVTVVRTAGFPHSDIHGSMPACGSPWLIAACCVLLRQSVAWHPPCALIMLDRIFLNSCVTNYVQSSSFPYAVFKVRFMLLSISFEKHFEVSIARSFKTIRRKLFQKNFLHYSHCICLCLHVRFRFSFEPLSTITRSTLGYEACFILMSP